MILLRNLLISVLMAAASVPALGQWTNGQSAEFVIGQPDFDTNTPGSGSQNFDRAVGVAIDRPNGKLYVSDYINNRVLRFGYPVTGNYPTAERIFGTGAAGTTDNSFTDPQHVAVDSAGNLYVGDDSNNRVMIFNSAHTASSDGVAANRVLGQSDFVSNTGATAINRMWSPGGVSVDSNDTLWVCDSSNHRILRFNNAPSKITGANADGVLGQTDFTSNGSGLSSAKVNYPWETTMVGTTLFVVDGNNHRVLRFDSAASKADGAAADGVLGQVDFTSGASGLSQTQLNGPQGLASDLHGRIYVADTSNNRLMIFNDAASKPDGGNADFVLGQADFTTNATNVGASGLFSPTAVAVDSINNKALIAEIYHHRVVVQSASSSLPALLSGFSTE